MGNGFTFIISKYFCLFSNITCISKGEKQTRKDNHGYNPYNFSCHASFSHSLSKYTDSSVGGISPILFHISSTNNCFLVCFHIFNLTDYSLVA